VPSSRAELGGGEHKGGQPQSGCCRAPSYHRDDLDMVGRCPLSARSDPEDMSAGSEPIPASCGPVHAIYDGSRRFSGGGDGILAYSAIGVHEGRGRASRAGGPRYSLSSPLCCAAREARCGTAAVPHWPSRPAWCWSATQGEGAFREASRRSGDTPNLASPSSGLGRAWDGVIAASSDRLGSGLFHMRDLGRPRSRVLPKPAYAGGWVEGVSASGSRFGGGPRGWLTVLIGPRKKRDSISAGKKHANALAGTAKGRS